VDSTTDTADFVGRSLHWYSNDDIPIDLFEHPENAFTGSARECSLVLCIFNGVALLFHSQTEPSYP